MKNIPRIIFIFLFFLLHFSALRARGKSANEISPLQLVEKSNKSKHRKETRLFPSVKKTSIIPLPAFSTNPNDKETYGILPVWLFLDKKDKVISIFAPSFTDNQIYGRTVTLRFFGYPDAKKKYRAIFSKSSAGNEEIDLRYEDLGIAENLFSLRTRILYLRDIGSRFFGLGADSPESGESDFTLTKKSGEITLGRSIFPQTQLLLTERLSQVKLERGRIDTLPDLQEKHSKVPGLKGSEIWSHRFSLQFDSLDSLDQPTEGKWAELYLEISRRELSSDYSYLRYGTQLKTVIPFLKKRAILVLRGLLEEVQGEKEFPFHERSMLGGEDLLRGFGDNRFFDQGRILFSLEQRITLFTTRIFKIRSKWEVAPFLESGRVFDQLSFPLFAKYQFVYGLGFRAVIPPNVVGRVDLGNGKEGIKFYVSLGYPF